MYDKLCIVPLLLFHTKSHTLFNSNKKSVSARYNDTHVLTAGTTLTIKASNMHLFTKSSYFPLKNFNEMNQNIGIPICWTDSPDFSPFQWNLHLFYVFFSIVNSCTCA